LGGILVGVLEKKLPISRSHWVILLCSLVTIPAGLVLIFNVPDLLAFAIIALSGAMIFLTAQIITIQVLAYIQIETPAESLGKVTAIAVALAIASYPVGQFLFGLLFEQFYYNMPWLVLFIAAFMTALVAIGSRKHFRNINMANLQQQPETPIKQKLVAIKSKKDLAKRGRF